MAIASGKRKKRKRKGRPDNPAQSKRFIEEARKLGVDESGEDFRKAMDNLLKPKGKRGNN
jgi:hypothetical protein